MKGTSRTFLIMLAMATILATVTTGAAVAGKCEHGNNPHCSGGGSGSGDGTISLVLLESTDGLPHYGQKVTFDVATTATDKPWVELDCYQGGVLVYQDWRGFFDGSLTGQVFILGTSNAWQSGDADCTAWLMTYTSKGWSEVVSTSFHVYA
jgi:hypothetical protein